MRVLCEQYSKPYHLEFTAMRPLILSVLSVAALSLSACGSAQWGGDDSGVTGTPVSGSGAQTVRQYAVSGFSELVLAGSDAVTVRRGENFSVTATGDPAALDRLLIRVRDGKLEVRPKSGMSLSASGPVRIAITMPALTDAVLAGSGTLDIDTLNGDKAELTVAGSGNVTLAGVAARKLELTLAGSGGVRAVGRVDEVEIHVAGSGNVTAPGLTATRAEISIAGSGGVSMAVSGTAQISAMGSGDVALTGGATCTTSRMGSGTVTCR
jgi:hypothetical protein